MSHPEQLTSETHVTNSIRVPHNMELKTVTGTGAMAQKEHGSYFHSTQVQFPAPIPGGSQLPLTVAAGDPTPLAFMHACAHMLIPTH